MFFTIRRLSEHVFQEVRALFQTPYLLTCHADSVIQPLAQIPPNRHGHDDHIRLCSNICAAHSRPQDSSPESLWKPVLWHLHPKQGVHVLHIKASSAVQSTSPGGWQSWSGGRGESPSLDSISKPCSAWYDLNLSSTSCFMFSSGHKTVWNLTRCPRERKTTVLSINPAPQETRWRNTSSP